VTAANLESKSTAPIDVIADSLSKRQTLLSQRLRCPSVHTSAYTCSDSLEMQNVPDSRRPSLAGLGEVWYRHRMTRLAQKLDKKLASWRPEVAAQVEQIITDVIELADTLDLQPSRTVVQEVLDTLDERQAG
jgi:hypothetical protein